MRRIRTNSNQWGFCCFILFLIACYLYSAKHHQEEISGYQEDQIYNLGKRLKQAESQVTYYQKIFTSTISNFSEETYKIPFDPYLNVFPHLKAMYHQNPLVNLNPFRFGSNASTVRTTGRIIIGIPTVHRDKKNYLIDTLKNLFENLREEEKSMVTFVVMFAERQFSDVINKTIDDVVKEFDTQIFEGLLQIIMPPPFYYPPDLDLSLKSTFNDDPERMYWRTKQNLDYVYLMLYVEYFFPEADYYMQLEDDVISKVGYVSAIADFADSHENWLSCDFSRLGFIGKLFKIDDLPLISTFITLFHREKPVDWNLDQLYLSRYCHEEESGCIKKRIDNVVRLFRKPPLFQHVGRYSSLPGKVQLLKESRFNRKNEPTVPVPHSGNPDAEVVSMIGIFTPEILSRFYTFSFPLTFNDSSMFTDNTTLINVAFTNTTKISRISFRYFARYQGKAVDALPFKAVIVKDDSSSLELEFPHHLTPVLTFDPPLNAISLQILPSHDYKPDLLKLSAIFITS